MHKYYENVKIVVMLLAQRLLQFEPILLKLYRCLNYGLKIYRCFFHYPLFIIIIIIIN